MKRKFGFSDEALSKINIFISKNQFLFLAIIIVFIGAIWRLWGVGQLKLLSQPELDYLNSSVSLIKGGWRLNIHELYRATGLYWTAAFGFISGYDVVIYRILQALLGTVSVLIFFLFVKSWFNKQVALIATLFYATNTVLVIFSQVLLDSTLIVTLQLLILYILTIAFREKNVILFALSGVLAAIGIFLSPVFLVSGILIALAALIVIARNTKLIGLYKYDFLVLLLPIFIALGFYFFYIGNYYTQILAYVNPGSFGAFYLNLGKNVLTIFSSSQFGGIYNVGTEPLVDPFIAVSVVCGIIYALFHAGKRKHQFVLLWLLFGLITISLSSKQDIGYIVMILPVVFILAATVLDYLLTSWTRTFPYNRPAKILMTVFFSAFLFLSIYYNYQKFFLAWQGSAVTKAAFNKTIVYKR